MGFVSRRAQILGSMAASVLIGVMSAGCTPEMKGTLRDLGITIPSSTPAVTPARASAPDAGPTGNSGAAAAADTAGEGWVVGSIGEFPQPLISLTRRGCPYGSVRILFHNQTDTVSKVIEFSSAQFTPTPTDFESGDKQKEKSATFAISLPEGRYVIDELRFAGVSDPNNRNCIVRNQFAVPFTVKAGVASYLGSLIASADWEPNRVGVMAPACGYFVVSDRSARDEPVLRKKYPQLTAPLQVELLAADSDEAKHYFRQR